MEGVFLLQRPLDLPLEGLAVLLLPHRHPLVVLMEELQVLPSVRLGANIVRLDLLEEPFRQLEELVPRRGLMALVLLGES